jgi:hypothetical protein
MQHDKDNDLFVSGLEVDQAFFASKLDHDRFNSFDLDYPPVCENEAKKTKWYISFLKSEFKEYDAFCSFITKRIDEFIVDSFKG